MRTFGAFWKTDGTQVYGEVQGEKVHVLKQPFWLGLEPSGENLNRHDLEIAVPVAPSKLIAVGLNYADHIAEMKRTPLGDAADLVQGSRLPFSRTKERSRSRSPNTRLISKPNLPLSSARPRKM